MRKIKFLIVALLLVGISTISLLPAKASSPDSLYSYDLRNSTSVVANQASANTSTNLNLVGNWTPGADGVTFDGNTTSLQSSSYAKPSTGATISATATQAVGAAVVFTQSTGCASDSQNITQIGSFANATTQVKLQLSKCVSNKMYPECRIAGALTPSTELAMRGTLALNAGTQYKLECVKSADQGSSAQLTMRTTDIATNVVTTNVFTINDTGSLSSTAYLSAGGKYPLTTLAKNTDQFRGVIAKLAYCKSADVLAAQSCLDQETALLQDVPPVTPPEEPPVVDPVDPTPDPETPPVVEPPVATDGTSDEIKFSYGSTRDEVVFSWRGTEPNLYYGLDETYGSQVVASNSAITPVDIAGPFKEVRLTGLNPGTRYHYKIGANGTDRTFGTAAADDTSFTAVAMGDTAPTSCRTYQQQTNDLVAYQAPDFVLHHGDIAIANECGVPSVHQYYMDIQSSFSTSAAFMPVWGNHEYGDAVAGKAPAGTPRDSLANYKGRSAIPNPQIVPNDTTTKTSHPGCTPVAGTSTNGRRGEDWGWFRTGRVVFISTPEPWPNAIADWRTKAAAVMRQAQNDPTVDFVVTYGHRPLLSSTSYTAPAGWDTAFNSLHALYSPSTTNPTGKYVLNLAGHRHGMEVFGNYRGATHVVNGGGGQGLINFGTTVSGSDFRMKHLGFSKLTYDASAHQLTFSMICGPVATGQSGTCTAGSTIYSRSYNRF